MSYLNEAMSLHVSIALAKHYILLIRKNKMYQLALKVKDRYIINNPGIVYLDKKELIPQVKDNKVLIQYSPFTVFQQIGGELKDITTKKEKV